MPRYEPPSLEGAPSSEGAPAPDGPPHPAAPRPDPHFVEVVATLVHHPSERLSFTPLTGGISSDIWRVDTPDGTVCAKRPLARLRATQTWEAPVARSTAEVDYLTTARRWVGDRVVEVLAHDPAEAVSVLRYYPPEIWHNWKTMLLEGRHRDVGPILGVTLAEIQTRAVADGCAPLFQNQINFDALRIDAYFRFIRTRHPRIDAIVDLLLLPGQTLVHGDFSPKNILVDDENRVLILDAETATWGSAAFDPAFLINHLVLKTLHLGDRRCLDHAARFWAAFCGHHEPPDGLETHVCLLVAGLMLARVFGKSPAEYLTTSSRSRVTRTATRLLDDPPVTLAILFDIVANAT